MSNPAEVLPSDMKRAAMAFRLATGVSCFFINKRGGRIQPEELRTDAESFCERCPRNRDGMRDQVCLYGRYQAERFGGRYVFFSPCGLTYCVSPIESDASGISGIFAGPMLMVDAEEFLLEELLLSALPAGDGCSAEDLERLRQQSASLPVIPADRVNALSELLFLAATALSREDTTRMSRQRDLLETSSAVSTSIHALNDAERNGRMPHYPHEKERELLTKISLGDKAGAQRILNDILGYVFFSSGSDFDIICARAQELVVMLSRGALEGGADPDEIFGLNHRYLADIRQLRSLEELTAWLSKILERFTDCVFNLTEVRHKDAIFQAVNYIRRHFSQRISLDDVARHVHLNASYLSRVFKEEMQTNFVSYVNNLRVETAKKYLLDSSVPLLEVAGMVGFEEQSYFTKVFKKITGITPGKYRESRGHAPGKREPGPP